MKILIRIKLMVYVVLFGLFSSCVKKRSSDLVTTDAQAKTAAHKTSQQFKITKIQNLSLEKRCKLAKELATNLVIIQEWIRLQKYLHPSTNHVEFIVYLDRELKLIGDGEYCAPIIVRLFGPISHKVPLVKVRFSGKEVFTRRGYLFLDLDIQHSKAERLLFKNRQNEGYMGNPPQPMNDNLPRVSLGRSFMATPTPTIEIVCELIGEDFQVRGVLARGYSLNGYWKNAE